jgi:diphosphomevalonate decarboxylase
VKYWGKQEPQIPENASISFTLDACFTLTTLEYKLKKERQPELISGSAVEMLKQVPLDASFEIYFEGEKKKDFKPKIATFFKRIEQICSVFEGF